MCYVAEALSKFVPQKIPHHIDNRGVNCVKAKRRETHLDLQLSSPLTSECTTRISPHSKSSIFVNFQNVLGVEDGPYRVDG